MKIEIPKSTEKYIINNFIIRGAFSKIYKGTYNNEECVIKKIHFDKFRGIESNIGFESNSKFLIKCLCKIDEYDSISLIFPYYKNGDFLEYIKDNNKKLTNYELKKFLFQMTTCINDLNNLGYTHLDIKLENFLLDESYNLVLSDFGSSNLVLSDNTTLKKINYPAGTNSYIAPELAKLYYGNKTDIWSVGVCIYMILTRNQLYQNVASYKQQKFKFNTYCPHVIDLLNLMLKINYNERISCKEALNHKCFL